MQRCTIQSVGDAKLSPHVTFPFILYSAYFQHFFPLHALDKFHNVGADAFKIAIGIILDNIQEVFSFFHPSQTPLR